MVVVSPPSQIQSMSPSPSIAANLSLWCDRTAQANPRHTILMYPNPDPAIARHQLYGRPTPAKAHRAEVLPRLIASFARGG
jgi:hypothetical protein